MVGPSNMLTPFRQAGVIAAGIDIVGSGFNGCVVHAKAQRFAGALGTCEIDNLRFVKIKARSS